MHVCLSNVQEQNERSKLFHKQIYEKIPWNINKYAKKNVTIIIEMYISDLLLAS